MARIASVYDEGIFAKPEYLCNKVDMQEFETAQDMMESNCLKVGYAHTLGFYEVGDGGEAYYRVVANPTGDKPNGMDVLRCKRLAAKIILSKIVSPESLGCTASNFSQIAFNRAIALAEINRIPLYSFSEYNIDYGIEISADNIEIKLNYIKGKNFALKITHLRECNLFINRIESINTGISIVPVGDQNNKNVSANLIEVGTIESHNGVTVECGSGSCYLNTFNIENIIGDNTGDAFYASCENLPTTYFNANELNIKSIHKHNNGIKIETKNYIASYGTKINACFENCTNAIVLSKVNGIDGTINCTEASSGNIIIDSYNTKLQIEGYLNYEKIFVVNDNSGKILDLRGLFISKNGNIDALRLYKTSKGYFFESSYNDNYKITINNIDFYSDNYKINIVGSGPFNIEAKSNKNMVIIESYLASNSETLNLTLNNKKATINLTGYPHILLAYIKYNGELSIVKVA